MQDINYRKNEMDPNTLVSVAEIRHALILRGVSLRGILDKQDLLKALNDVQLDPYDCVQNKNTLSAFVRSHGFLADGFCSKESDLVARAKQVRSICLKQGDYEGLKSDLKTVDDILKARDDYQVLEISKTTTSTINARDVLVAFRNVIRKVHPDKNSAQGATEAAARVNQAFERLKSGKSSVPSSFESKQPQPPRYKHSDEEDFLRRQREAERNGEKKMRGDAPNSKRKKKRDGDRGKKSNNDGNEKQRKREKDDKKPMKKSDEGGPKREKPERKNDNKDKHARD